MEISDTIFFKYIYWNIKINDIDFSQIRYELMLEKVAKVDFTNYFYQYSAVGRANVAETILYANNLVQTPNLEDARNDAEKLRFQRKIEQHIEIQGFLNSK